MNHILSDMLSKYRPNTFSEKQNALKEVCQSTLLSALSHTDFFEHVAFYGGTCLRIFYGLDRFSEDLDFGVVKENDDFSLGAYMSAIEDAFAIYGLGVEASVSGKAISTNVESAYLQTNARETMLSFYPKDPEVERIVFNQKIKVKFEVSKSFIPGAAFENKRLFLPEVCWIKTYDKSSLFSGKIGAVLGREWKHRVKGRDYYDFAFYVAREIKPNMEYLQNELRKDGVIGPTQVLTPDLLVFLLKQKIESINFSLAKDDVLSFVSPSKDLSFWTKDFFLEIVDRMVF